MADPTYSFETCKTTEDWTRWLSEMSPEEEAEMATAMMNFRLNTATEQERIKYSRLSEVLEMSMDEGASAKFKEAARKLEIVMHEEVSGAREPPSPLKVPTMDALNEKMKQPGINSPLMPRDRSRSSELDSISTISSVTTCDADRTSMERDESRTMYARTRSKVSASAKVSTVAAVVSPVNAVKADQSPAEETSARTRRFARPLGHKALQSPAVETRELPTATVAAAVEEAHVTPLQSHIMHIRGSRSVDKNDVTSEAKPPSTASLKSTRQAARSKPKYTFRARLNATSSSLDSTFDDDEGRENILGSPGATPAKRGRKRLALESDISSLADTSVVNGLQSHLLGTESNETASSSIAQMSGQSTPAVEVDNKRTQADRAVKPFTDCTVSLQDQLLLAEIGAAKETAMAMAQKRLKITMAMEHKRLKTELECEKLKLEIAALKKLAATKK